MENNNTSKYFYHGINDISFLCEILKAKKLQSNIIQIYGYNTIEYQRYNKMLWCDNFVFLSCHPYYRCYNLVLSENIINDLNVFYGKYNKEILVYDEIDLKKYLVGICANIINVDDYSHIKGTLDKFGYNIPLNDLYGNEIVSVNKVKSLIKQLA